MYGRKRHAKARVLHADFDGQAFSLGQIHLKELGGEITHYVAQTVVKNNHGKHQRTALGDIGLADANDGHHNQNNRHHGNERQAGCGHAVLSENRMNRHADGNRNQNDLAD